MAHAVNSLKLHSGCLNSYVGLRSPRHRRVGDRSVHVLLLKSATARRYSPTKSRDEKNRPPITGIMYPSPVTHKCRYVWVSSAGWRELGDGGFGDPAGEELAEVVTAYLFGDGLEVFDLCCSVEVPLDELPDGGEERLVSDFKS